MSSTAAFDNYTEKLSKVINQQNVYSNNRNLKTNIEEQFLLVQLSKTQQTPFFDRTGVAD